MYTNPRPPYQNELYHHGILGMHWGIRRYQPYRKGEKVKGGKEVGEATKVEQRPVSYKELYKINRKLSKNDYKILKLRSKQYGKSFADKNEIANKIVKIRKKNAKLRDKAGYSNTMETDEYRREYERVSSGGVDKDVDAAAKKVYDALKYEKQHPSVQSNKAVSKARNDLIDAQHEYMKKTGIQRYNKDQLSQAVDSYKKATESSKKALNDFETKKFTKEMQDEYLTMRSTDPRYEKYQALRKQLYELNLAYNKDKSREQLWSDELKKIQIAHSGIDSDSLMHHGILGMHWGIRRYQPYRKGDKVKGGKEIGKATKVEQRSIADRVRKGMAAVNKIKKEIHKGKLEKAEYKYEMAQLKDAKKEVKKARRREAEERIRQRVREHREEQREERRLEEERKDRNLERARGIAESAAQVGTLLYGAYQLKKGMQDRGLLGGNQNGTNSSNPVHAGPQQTNSASTSSSNPLSVTRSGANTSHAGPTHTLSNPNAPTNPNPLQIHTSGSHSATSSLPTITTSHNSSSTSGPTHVLSPSSTVSSSNTAATNSHGSTTSRGRQMVQDLLNSARTSHQANQSLSSHDRDRQQALDNNYRRSADRNSQIVGLQSAIAQARLNADDSFNGHRSSASQARMDRLEQLSNRANRLMNQEVRLTSNADAVANQYRQRATRAGRRQQSRDDQLNAIARANGMSANQLYNASKKDKLKALAKFLGGSGSRNSSEDLNDELLGRMRDLQSSGNGARQSDIDDIRRELNKLLEHSMKSNNELYHYGVLGMHWGIRRYQPYTNGKRGTFLGKIKEKIEKKKRDNERKVEQNSKMVENMGGHLDTGWPLVEKFDKALNPKVKGGVWIDTKLDSYKDCADTQKVKAAMDKINSIDKKEYAKMQKAATRDMREYWNVLQSYGWEGLDDEKGRFFSDFKVGAITLYETKNGTNVSVDAWSDAPNVNDHMFTFEYKLGEYKPYKTVQMNG